MRKFGFITRGEVAEDIQKTLGLRSFTLIKLHRLEQQGKIPQQPKTGGGWRIYTPTQVEEIKKAVAEYYNIPYAPNN